MFRALQVFSDPKEMLIVLVSTEVNLYGINALRQGSKEVSFHVIREDPTLKVTVWLQFNVAGVFLL